MSLQREFQADMFATLARSEIWEVRDTVWNDMACVVADIIWDCVATHVCDMLVEDLTELTTKEQS